jgi:hypothetical protein
MAHLREQQLDELVLAERATGPRHQRGGHGRTGMGGAE